MAMDERMLGGFFASWPKPCLLMALTLRLLITNCQYEWSALRNGCVSPPKVASQDVA
jgi:hypothetical protein